MKSERRKSPIDTSRVEPHMCSLEVRLEILGQVPFFAGLEARALEAVNQRFVERGYLPGEIIYFAGDPAERLYVVADGRVKLLRHTPAGKDVLLDMLSPGDFFGSLSSLGENLYAGTAQAHTAACVLSVEAEDFRAILEENPGITLKVLDIVSSRLEAAHEMVRQLSAYSAEQRVAYALLMLSKKLGRPDEVGLLIQTPLSRDDLAQMTGTTTETASRVLSQFQKDGLIESGRQWVAIKDPEGLQAITG